MHIKKWIARCTVMALVAFCLPAASWARGTEYQILWPTNHVGPVYVQVYDIRCYPPYEVLDNFQVWVTWGQETKCYQIGNRGSYVLKLYKYPYHQGPMILVGNAASFKIRYSLCPPWV